MSDLKYILAGGEDDGEHARFGCLAMVRYAVAAVVTVLTIAVIALSIHAVLRSEDMGLSVNKGYIGAENLHIVRTYQKYGKLAAVNRGNSKVAEPATAVAKLSHRQASFGRPTTVGNLLVNSIATERPLAKDCFLECSGPSGGGTRDQPTQVTFMKPNQTNLRVILIASNPGGRTKIDCNSTHVSLIDMLPPYGQIGDVTLDNFTVPPQTTITLQKRLSNTDTSYIWENYYSANRFSVKVQVTSSVTSYPLGKKGNPVQLTYVCQPVTIGRIADEAIYASDDHVRCTTTSS